MEFRRITNLPPYVFTIINNLKIEARRAGADVIDLGFGNPDIPSPQIAVDKLAEAARNPRNHRYSLSRGLPKLREAIAGYYQRTWNVDLDPELEVTNTIGSKEGFSHLMWVLLDRGDAAIVPSPSYPIHIYGPLFAGADLRQVPMKGLSHPEARANFTEDFFASLHTAYDVGWPKPRVLVISFPHNPTGATVDLPFMQRVVDFCRQREMVVVHDFAYADVGFNGVKPPSILQAEGAKHVAVEQYSMTKSFSMAGWRSAFLVGNAEIVQALVKLKSYLDYGTFQPIQIAATVTLNEASDYPIEICDVRAALRHVDRRACQDRLGCAQAGWLDVRLGADPRAVHRDELGRVLLDAGQGVQRGALAGRRLRAGRRGLRPIRTDRERAAHPAGDSQPQARPDQAGLTGPIDRPTDRPRFTSPSHARYTPCLPCHPCTPSSSASGCPTALVRSGRWRAGSAPCEATCSTSRSSKSAPARRSTSWS
jgi:alanine-synthesizing transaminase